MNKSCFMFFYLLIISFVSVSQESFIQGKEFFSKNNVEEALYLFEEAMITAPTEETYKYLAESYTILEFFEDAVLVLEEALAENVEDLPYFYFKLGNAYYSVGDYKGAIDSYLEVINIQNGYVNEAFLNIANVSVELKLYTSAIDNYTKYLELEPNSKQKRKIIKMIFLLKKSHREQESMLRQEQIQKEDELKKIEEERVFKENEDRLIDEERARIIVDNQRLEADKELKERALAEERLLYDQEEKALIFDKNKLIEDEKRVLNPPDPDIEAQKRALQIREEELYERELKVEAGEKALYDAELELEKSKLDLSDSVETPNESMEQAPTEKVVKQKSEEEIRLEIEAKQEREELARMKQEEEIRQQALMNDILESLDKIGENAKGISASSESAFGELEGSSIDE